MPIIELARAFGLLGSHALMIAQPLAHDFLNDAALERMTTLLESPALLDRLRDRLEREGS
jgi:hypothetical protein